ncbi:MAG TPA: hypothetical protein VFV51_16800 [Vicinamibacterales bacterium]|nr:hypothetical protein [Vicinamibacterales bacterium]
MADGAGRLSRRRCRHTASAAAATPTKPQARITHSIPTTDLRKDEQRLTMQDSKSRATKDRGETAPMALSHYILKGGRFRLIGPHVKCAAFAREIMA